MMKADMLEMWACLDGDGDGEVSKAEFKIWYQGNMKNGEGGAPTDDAFEKLWKKIDRDGDGILSMGELCSFFGISFGAVQADLDVRKNMSDEEIMEAIAMQDQLQAQKDAMLKREKDKKESAQTKRTAGVREGVTVIKKGDETSKEAELLDACGMLEAADKGKVETMLETEGIQVRVEHASEKTMPMHRLAANFQVMLMGKVHQKTAKEFRIADINSQDKRGFSPIFYALEGRADKLLEVKKDKEKMEKYMEDQKKTILYLLNNGSDMYVESQANGWNVMHMAAHMGSVEAVTAILDGLKTNKALTNQQIRRLLNHCDHHGRTPLHIASMRADATEAEPAIVKLLLKNGSDPDICDKGKYTASTLGAKSGRRNSKEFIDSFSGAQKAERQRRNSRDSKESIGGAPAVAEAGPGK